MAQLFSRRVLYPAALAVLILFGVSYVHSPAFWGSEERRAPINYAQPVFTEKNAWVCPTSILTDVRRDYGPSAFRDAELSYFFKKSKFEKLGCGEWDVGIQVIAQQFQIDLALIGRSEAEMPLRFTREYNLRN